jgi:replicative DNA helicase
MHPHPDPVGPGQESVWSYPRPPSAEVTGRRVVVEVAGSTIADTRRAVRVCETSHPPVYYVPREDIADGVLDDNGMSLERLEEVFHSLDLDLEAANDVLWDDVVTIEPDGVEEVFDATVIGTHNFIANGIAVHNSIEQDADMVILLHREAAYEKDSPREGEADLIVAKHRNGPTDTIVVAFQGHFSRFTNMANNF